MKHIKYSTYFFYFLIFNLCFLGLQAGFLYSQNNSLISSIVLPQIVWQQIVKTGCIHIFFYLCLSLIQAFIFWGAVQRPWCPFSPDQGLIIIWSLSVCALLSANAYYFPLSIFSKFFSPIPPVLIMSLLGISGFALIILLGNSLFYWRNKYLMLVAIPFIFTCVFKNTINANPEQYTTKPNIIILGIDSLSPESITQENMPFFSTLIKDSVQFTNAISPLARTYPAWSSILTGLYTKHHHAEENLVAKNTVNSQASIAWLLRNQGYNTIFATDDRRFNSIGKEFGFKQIIGPKLGVNDIVLGTFNDWPLSNLLINFKISAWLFPYNYMNRASFFSYYPQTFNDKLKNELRTDLLEFPVFLAIHFTLPHWPYAWAESLPEQVHNEFSLEKRNVLYQQALQKIDKQFQSVFIYLKQKNYFENSLLILLSDHGEALYYPGSRLTNSQNYQGKSGAFAKYLKKNTATVLNKSAGHGSDILSPKQYHNVLAFRIYKNGEKITQTAKISTRVALLDLAPTILNFLHFTPTKKMDGISLLQFILNPTLTLPQRIFYIESGMFPNQLLSKQKSVEIGAHFYNVNPISGELEIKPDKIKEINEQKLYGIISGDWILALYPDEKNYIPVIQNLMTGLWIDDLHSSFAQSTPAIQMYQQMQQFYGKKLFLPLP